VSRDRALGWLSLAAGVALVMAVQLRAPVAVPLYDGVPVTEPYRYLHPTGSQAGNPTSFQVTKPVSGSQSMTISAYTADAPPQAQLIALEDAFQVPADATEIRVSIAPVEPEEIPAEGVIAGNVYRFAVTDQTGRALVPKRCDRCRTLVLRAPPEVTAGTIAYLDNGTWTNIGTFHAGGVAMYQASVDALGDYAVIASALPGSGGFDPIIVAVLALAVLLVAVAGLFWYRRRPPSMPVAQLRPSGRVPSKRRSSKKSPRGRSSP
jgi:hypothetical protein